MDYSEGFVARWGDVLTPSEVTLEVVESQCPKVNYYSHKVRSQKYYLKSPYEHVYLTPRELQTVLQLMQHKTMREAAKQLDLSHRTVEFYLKNIKKKLGCFKKNNLMQILYETLDFENLIKIL
jgi:DNA-binding CsgD family transcriptional regulator